MRALIIKHEKKIDFCIPVFTYLAALWLVFNESDGLSQFYPNIVMFVLAVLCIIIKLIIFQPNQTLWRHIFLHLVGFVVIVLLLINKNPTRVSLGNIVTLCVSFFSLISNDSLFGGQKESPEKKTLNYLKIQKDSLHLPDNLDLNSKNYIKDIKKLRECYYIIKNSNNIRNDLKNNFLAETKTCIAELKSPGAWGKTEKKLFKTFFESLDNLIMEQDSILHDSPTPP